MPDTLPREADSVTKVQPVILQQGFSNWATCTLRDTFAYRKGYI